MMFVKVFEGDEIIDLNTHQILKVEKQREGYPFDRAIITDVNGNKYKSLSDYNSFFMHVKTPDKE